MRCFGFIMTCFHLITLASGCSDPEVVEDKAGIVVTRPADGETGVARGSFILITFDHPIAEDALTMQSNGGTCDQNAVIQLSPDQFESCQGGIVSFVAHTDQRRIEVVPFPSMLPLRTYQLTVLDSISFRYDIAFDTVNFSFTTGEEL